MKLKEKLALLVCAILVLGAIGASAAKKSNCVKSGDCTGCHHSGQQPYDCYYCHNNPKEPKVKPENIHYKDMDYDGYSDGTRAEIQDGGLHPSGWFRDYELLDVKGDCDDSNQFVYPGAVEICDGLDNDCAKGADDGLAFIEYFLDSDGDGYGDSGSALSACTQPSGFVTVGGDCDDGAPTTYPGAAELCDGADNDCDPSSPDGSEDPLNGTACDGPDSDLCLEGIIRSCADGVLDCSDNTGNDVDIYDGIDNDCDGIVDAGAYSNSIAIDGTNDFNDAEERFATSSTGYDAYVAWDSDYLYVGFEGADVASSSATNWLLIYIDGDTADTMLTGVLYNTQQPALLFAAGYHVAWRTDGFTTALVNDGTVWGDALWDFAGDVSQWGTFVELRLPLADLGITAFPAALRVHLSMISEAPSAEWSYAAVPAGSFTDGFDPDYGQYFEFTIGGTTVPNAHTALP